MHFNSKLGLRLIDYLNKCTVVYAQYYKKHYLLTYPADLSLKLYTSVNGL